MSYNKRIWRDYPDRRTPINANNLNQIEDQLETNAASLDDIENQLDNFEDTFEGKVKTMLLNMVYPVGSIYMSLNNVSPATFLGGTWTPLTNRVLVGAGDFYNVDDVGGFQNIFLQVKQLPSHTHTFTGSAVTSGNQSANHTHTTSVTAAGTVTSSANTVDNHRHPYTWIGLAASSTYSKGSAGSFFPVNAGQESSSGYAGAHTHTITSTFKGSAVNATSGNQSANHTHTVTAKGTNSSTGGGESIDIRNPYRAVYMWKRIA